MKTKWILIVLALSFLPNLLQACSCSDAYFCNDLHGADSISSMKVEVIGRADSYFVEGIVFKVHKYFRNDYGVTDTFHIYTNGAKNTTCNNDILTSQINIGDVFF